jgi:hypothetical protein
MKRITVTMYFLGVAGDVLTEHRGGSYDFRGYSCGDVMVLKAFNMEN